MAPLRKTKKKKKTGGLRTVVGSVVFLLIWQSISYNAMVNDLFRQEQTLLQNLLVYRPIPGRQLFEPGSLSDYNRSQTMQMCYTGNPAMSQTGDKKKQSSKNDPEDAFQVVIPHLQKPSFPGCAYSAKYKFLLWYIGKTGSSTQRVVMKDTFEALHKGQNKACRTFKSHMAPDSGNLRVVVTRDPVQRFISGVRETFDREKVFDKDDPPIPTEYAGFLKHIRGLSPERRAEIKTGATAEDLQLKTQMFEEFILSYDGRNVFNSHLSMQMPKMFRPDLKLNDPPQWQTFDVVLESDRLTQDLQDLAARVGAPQPKAMVKRSSDANKGRVIDFNQISDATYQHICRLFATDLCCLNYALPEACQRDDIAKGKRVMCEWVPAKTPAEKPQIRAVYV